MNFKKNRILGKTGLMVRRIGLASGYGIPANAVEKAFYEYGINYHFLSSPSKKGMEEGLITLDRGPLSESEMIRIRNIGTYIHGK